MRVSPELPAWPRGLFQVNAPARLRRGTSSAAAARRIPPRRGCSIPSPRHERGRRAALNAPGSWPPKPRLRRAARKFAKFPAAAREENHSISAAPPMAAAASASRQRRRSRPRAGGAEQRRCASERQRRSATSMRPGAPPTSSSAPPRAKQRKAEVDGEEELGGSARTTSIPVYGTFAPKPSSASAARSTSTAGCRCREPKQAISSPQARPELNGRRGRWRRDRKRKVACRREIRDALARTGQSLLLPAS